MSTNSLKINYCSSFVNSKQIELNYLSMVWSEIELDYCKYGRTNASIAMKQKKKQAVSCFKKGQTIRLVYSIRVQQ